MFVPPYTTLSRLLNEAGLLLEVSRVRENFIFLTFRVDPGGNEHEPSPCLRSIYVIVESGLVDYLTAELVGMS